MKVHSRLIQIVKFERDMEKREVNGGSLKIAQTRELPTNPHKALLNYRFSKVYYVFAFNPITLEFSKRTDV